MSQFDEAIQNILKETRERFLVSELNMGKGGVANQSGSTANNVPNQQQQGQQSSPTGQPNTNPSQPNPTNTTIQNAQQPSVNNQIPAAPDEGKEFTNLLQLQKSNPEAFNKHAKALASDPDKFSRFIGFLSQPMGQ